jgi:hypothetical protein
MHKTPKAKLSGFCALRDSKQPVFRLDLSSNQERVFKILKSKAQSRGEVSRI